MTKLDKIKLVVLDIEKEIAVCPELTNGRYCHECLALDRIRGRLHQILWSKE